MIGVLADQRMRQQARAGPTALDGARRQWGLDNRVKSHPAQALRDRTNRFKTKRPGTYSSFSVISSPSVFSLPPQRVQSSPWGQNFVMPVRMIRQRLAAVLARCLVSSGRLRGFGLFVGRFTNCLIFFEGQVTLIEALGTHTKSMAVLARQFMFELLDELGLRLDLIRQKTVHSLHFCGVVRCDVVVFQHCRSYTGSGTLRES